METNFFKFALIPLEKRFPLLYGKSIKAIEFEGDLLCRVCEMWIGGNDFWLEALFLDETHNVRFTRGDLAKWKRKPLTRFLITIL